MNPTNLTLLVATFLALLAPTTSRAQDPHDDHDHDAHAEPDGHAEAHAAGGTGLSLTEGWLEPWRHRDFSPRGTPFIHLFGLEPAFLDRDLFFDYVHAESAEGDAEESELGVELEYALTRRLGLVVELPVVSVNPDRGETETGLGDAAIAPRALLVETDRFLLSGNLELTVPTGSESRGLGGGEVAVAPSVSTWLDLGRWVTLSTQFGTEHGLETGDSELFYTAALTWSFQGPDLLAAAGTGGGRAHDHAGHAPESHLPHGLTSLILEYTGRTVLSGDDRDRSTGEVLLGVSHTLNEHLEVRGAYQLPVGGPRDIDYAYVLSVILHF